MYTGGSDEQEIGAAAETSGAVAEAAFGVARDVVAASTTHGRGDDRGPLEDRSSALDQTLLSVPRNPAAYRLADEPLLPSADIDWRYLYELIRERTEREEDRGKALDAKVTALLGGVVAFIGFSFRANESVWNASAALLYFVPLLILGQALLTKHGERAPSVKSLRTFFPTYPVSTLERGVDSMLVADAVNVSINNRKAARIDLATILTGMATIVVLITQFALAVGFAVIPVGSNARRPASLPTKPALITSPGVIPNSRSEMASRHC